MIEILLVILILLWLTGNIHITGFTFPHQVLLVINRYPFRIIDLLVLLLILWIIGILPSPFREIGGVLFVLWILSILGFIAIAGLSNLIIIAIIVGVVVSIIRG